MKAFCAALLLIGALIPPLAAEEEQEKLVALERAEAEYPKKAYDKCIEGHVVVRFIVTTDGTTKDIQVLSSRPARVFEKAAVAAVEKWRFEPRKINGVLVQREATQRLIFEPGCTR
ncbi:MAG: energy transducer TonB [Gammaproteobacteria bacterium]|nr:energy transducer TonB [Gammaproteobacteria bacterium]